MSGSFCQSCTEMHRVRIGKTTLCLGGGSLFADFFSQDSNKGKFGDMGNLMHAPTDLVEELWDSFASSARPGHMTSYLRQDSQICSVWEENHPYYVVMM